MLTEYQKLFVLGVLGLTFLLSLRIWYRLFKRDVVDKSQPIVELVSYIQQGCMYFVKKQIYTISIVFFVFFIPVLLTSFIFKSANIIVFFMLIIGGLTSGLVGYLSVKWTIRSIYKMTSVLHASFSEQYKLYFSSGRLLGLMLLTTVLFDMCFWYWIFDFIFKHNFLNISQFVFQSYFSVDWSPLLFENPDFLEMYHLIFGKLFMLYVFGFALRTFLSRLEGGIFASSSDIASDFVGQTEFDLLEDDLRNPASIADQVGDQVKNSFSFSLHFISAVLFSTVTIALFGMITGVFYDEIQTISLIIAPFIVLCLLIIGVNLEDVLFRKSATSILNVRYTQGFKMLMLFLYMIGASFMLPYLGMISIKAWIAFSMGLLGNIILFLISLVLVNYQFPFVRNLVKRCELGAMSTVIYGLTVGLTGTVITFVIITMLMAVVFFLSGVHINILTDFYNLGFFSLGLLSGAFRIFQYAIGISSVDNAVGCNNMLNSSGAEKSSLGYFELIGSMSSHVVNNIITIVTLLSGTMWVFFYAINIKTWVSNFEKKGVLKHLNPEFVETLNQKLPHLEGGSLTLKLEQIFDLFNIHLLNPILTIGFLVGAAVIISVITLIFFAIEKNTSGITKLMRHEFSSKPGIWTGETLPDYESVMVFSMKSAQRWMFIICGAVLFLTWFVGAVLGVTGVIGCLVGAFITGTVFSILFNFAGTAWKMAQKVIEIEDPNYAGTIKHISASVGANIGDVLKDGVAPSIIIALQVIALLSLLTIPIALKQTLLHLF